MYYGYHNYYSNTGIWVIISSILAIVLGFVLYFTFLSKKNESKYTGFLGWMYDFLNFKKFTLEVILKITYLICALFITLSSLSYIGANFFFFLVYLVLGNLVVRIIYEFSLLLLVICRNVIEINKKLSNKNNDDKDNNDKE